MSATENAHELNATAASVLGFLTLGPLTGWDLNALAQVSVNHFWNMTRSQIYRELATLETSGHVEGDDVGARNARRYRITPGGRKALRKWLGSDAGDSVTRNPDLVRIFFAAELTKAERRKLIASSRKRTAEKLATLEAVLPMAAELSPGAAATALQGIAVERAVLAWLDDAPWGLDV